MPQYDAVRRRLVVCCDGTWQSSVSGERNIPSNVTRLSRHLAKSAVVRELNPKTEQYETVLYQQLVFYDPGVGTGDLSEDDVTRQGGTGAGLAANVIEAYNWLVLNYEPGDKIYCFGFSRGAYTARSLSGFITTMGICSPLDMQFFPEVYDLYEGALYPASQDDSVEVKQARKAFEAKKKLWMEGSVIKASLGQDVYGKTLEMTTGKRDPITEESKQVEVVGVWDTVGSLGVPKIGGWFKIPTFSWSNLDKPGRQFHDVSISNNVRHAFHALALDERRRPFSPTLWYIPKDAEVPRPPDLSLKQVWFPGVHINAGGGSDDLLKARQSDCEQLANITFAWMVEQVRPYLAFDDASLKKAMEDQQALLAMLHKDYEADNIKLGWAKGRIIDSFEEASFAIKLGGSRWRQPGETWQPESLVNKTERRTTDLGVTNEEIHPCVFYRMCQLNKRSPSLEKFRRVPCANPKQGYKWVKKGEEGEIIELPESRIGHHGDDIPNIERVLAKQNGAEEYLHMLDEMYATGVNKTQSCEAITKLSV